MENSVIHKIQTLIQYLEGEQKAALNNANVLNQDNRADEANLAKVQANIFGIVIAVCRAAEKQENPAAFIQDRMKTIPQAWVQALDAAERHGDHAKAAIERLKLETMSQISETLNGIWEDKP